MDIQKLIDRVKIQTLMHQPFFGAGACKLVWEQDDSIETACTNGKFIKFSSEFLTSLTPAEQIGLAVHEVMHVYSKHHLRRGNRDPYYWNVAADYFINLIIQDAVDVERSRRGKTCMELPAGALLDNQYRGMSTEQIYDLIIQDDDGGDEGGDIDGDGDCEGDGPTTHGPKPPQGNRPSTWGDVIDAPVSGDAEREAAEREVEIMVEQAHNTAKSQGKDFGAAESLLDAYKKPKVDWRSVLRNLMQTLTKVDYTYTRPHKNHTHGLMQLGIFIPDFHRENMGEIVVAIDTSGSVSTDELQQFLGETESICNDLTPSKVHVVQCDARVAHVDTFEMGEPFNVKRIHGRGGTLFQPVFDWIEEEGIKPMAVVYLTDGYAPDPDPVDYPVFWAVTSNYHAHLSGEVLELDFN